MIRIKPTIDFVASCPRCGKPLQSEKVIWQGIHVCAAARCSDCNADIVTDLPVGHALFTPSQVDMTAGRLYIERDGSESWFGEPLLRSLQEPSADEDVFLNVEHFAICRQAVILNCIDFLYGHGLLKLLNAEHHLGHLPELGLIVIVPEYLRWMVPDGVAEIWTVKIPLSRAQLYYPRLAELIDRECSRFTDLWLSPAHSHPIVTNISRYTHVPRHDFEKDDFRLTFIWREDRLWLKKRILVGIARRIGLMPILLSRQNSKVRYLFTLLRKRFPTARFTVTGMGNITCFPGWIEDRRVTRFNDDIEVDLCRIYSESRLVIGVHGSNLLLPSAHAGLTLNLMPDNKWSNIAQDVIYQEDDSRLASYRYRYLPLKIDVMDLADIAVRQISGWDWHRRAMSDNVRERDEESCQAGN
jgi:hypothetical protein